jgi:hypothetical protein
MKNPLFNIRPRPPIISLRPAQQVKQQVLRKGVVYPCAAGAEGMTSHDSQGGLVVGGKGDAE